MAVRQTKALKAQERTFVAGIARPPPWSVREGGKSIDGKSALRVQKAQKVVNHARCGDPHDVQCVGHHVGHVDATMGFDSVVSFVP